MEETLPSLKMADIDLLNKLEKIRYCITGTIKLKASTAGSLLYCFRFLIYSVKIVLNFKIIPPSAYQCILDKHHLEKDGVL